MNTISLLHDNLEPKIEDRSTGLVELFAIHASEQVIDSHHSISCRLISCANKMGLIWLNEVSLHVMPPPKLGTVQPGGRWDIGPKTVDATLVNLFTQKIQVGIALRI